MGVSLDAMVSQVLGVKEEMEALATNGMMIACPSTSSMSNGKFRREFVGYRDHCTSNCTGPRQSSAGTSLVRAGSVMGASTCVIQGLPYFDHALKRSLARRCLPLSEHKLSKAEICKL